MNLVIISQSTPFFVPNSVKKVINHFPGFLKGIIVVPSTKLNLFEEFAKRLKTFGIIVTLRILVNFLYYKLAQFYEFFFSFNNSYDISKLAKLNKISFLSTKDINSSKSLKFISRLKPDLILSISPPQKFHERLLKLPTKGCLNVHGSLLPLHRGLQPSFWSLYYGDSKAGCTVHKMSSKLDEGNVLAQTSYKIKEHYTQFDLIKINKILGVKLLIETSKIFLRGNYNEIEIDVSQGNYNSFPEKKHYIAFRNRRRKII